MQLPFNVPLVSKYKVVVAAPVTDNSVEGVEVPPAPIFPWVANCPEDPVVVAVPPTINELAPVEIEMPPVEEA